MMKLNLHLFDTQTTTLTGSGNDLSPEMKTYYEKRLLDNAEPNLIHDQFADKYPIPKNGGKTIEFRKFSPLAKAVTPITEGVTPNGNKLNVTASTATISQYGDWIQLSDLLDSDGHRQQRPADHQAAGQPERPHPGHRDPGGAGGRHQRAVRPQGGQRRRGNGCYLPDGAGRHGENQCGFDF